MSVALNPRDGNDSRDANAFSYAGRLLPTDFQKTLQITISHPRLDGKYLNIAYFNIPYFELRCNALVNMINRIFFSIIETV